ncbi:hypothetical protein D9Q98_009423 [Chlorella vulgaris]|uniref:Glycosyl transferase CAP10 domain-containing protein n=1 Tax=Chlorella vulgaris TaxID=3077 RepID=A0A9D4YSM1_CHLVU|nr:hypothetical protein D9Q98_009423 [Chlorella vulgaris]
MPANLIGGALLMLFIFKVVTTNPFPSMTTPEGRDDPLERAWRSSFVDVSRRSHAYLRGALWDKHSGSFTKNVSATYDPADEVAAQQLLAEQSRYLDLIRHDLQPWKDTGITKDMVEAASMLYDKCDGDMIRVQIINGSLWVHHITERLEGGWYPASLGPGNAAAKGRVPYAILAFMDTLRTFPGQVPDVDLVLHTADFPCVSRSSWVGAAARPPPRPLLSFQGGRHHLDLPFPDATYWGHEHQYLQDPWGAPVQGWANQAELLVRKYENVSLLDRIPQAQWRGRTKDERYPGRDHLRRVFVGCMDELKAAGRGEDAALLNVLSPALALQDSCDYRYNVYIESRAYASNLKQKVVCGSLLVALRTNFWEFFSRGMRPGGEFVELSSDPNAVCEQVVAVTRDMNAAFGAAYASGQLASSGETTPLLARQLKKMRRDKRLASVLEGSGVTAGARGPAPEVGLPLASGSGGNFSWGSSLMPWEIAANGQRFILENVRMQDVLLYIRDLLRAYSTLQRFQVAPSGNLEGRSVCYSGRLLLEQFGTPYATDAKTVEAAYPWLRTFGAGCPEVEGDR